MRVCSANFLNQLADNPGAATVKARVILDGRTVLDELPVESWDFTEELDQQVKASFTCTVVDACGELIPYELTDTLAPGGGRIILDYIIGSESMRVGEYVITQSSPEQVLILNGACVKARTGKIKLDCKDLLELYSADRFISPVASIGSNTVAVEISRLARARRVVTLPGVGRAMAPAGATYERGRLETLGDLAKRAGGFLRVSPGGALELAPLNPPANAEAVPVLGGETGVLISYSQVFDLEKIYNAVIASNNEEGGGDSGGERFVGAAFEPATESPLGWGGPIGYRPMFYASDLIKNQRQADEAARSRLAAHLAGRVIELEVACLPDPRLQVGDMVVLPVIGTGSNVDEPGFKGKIVSLSMSGSASSVGEMRLKVEVAAVDFAKAVKTVKDQTIEGIT